MIALLLLLAPADVTATAAADVRAVRLSGVVRLTLSIEGPAPLRVELPELPSEILETLRRTTRATVALRK